MSFQHYRSYHHHHHNHHHVSSFHYGLLQCFSSFPYSRTPGQAVSYFLMLSLHLKFHSLTLLSQSSIPLISVLFISKLSCTRWPVDMCFISNFDVMPGQITSYPFLAFIHLLLLYISGLYFQDFTIQNVFSILKCAWPKHFHFLFRMLLFVPIVFFGANI